MRTPKDIDLARASVRSAKQRLDDALTDYGQAIAKYHDFVERQLSEETAQKPLDGDHRLPKGEVQGFLRLAFSKGSLGATRFKGVVARVEAICGKKLSEATIRQTLYRMEQQGELERYSGKWSAGRRLLDPTP